MELEVVHDLLVVLRCHVLEADSVRERLPLEVKHRVKGRSLNPPVTPLHRLLYELRVVARHHHIFEAVAVIYVREGNLRKRLLRRASLLLACVASHQWRILHVLS